MRSEGERGKANHSQLFSNTTLRLFSIKRIWTEEDVQERNTKDRPKDKGGEGKGGEKGREGEGR